MDALLTKDEVRRTGRLDLDFTQKFTTQVWGYNVGRFCYLTTFPLYIIFYFLLFTLIQNHSWLIRPDSSRYFHHGIGKTRLPSPSDVRYHRRIEDYARLGRPQE